MPRFIALVLLAFALAPAAAPVCAAEPVVDAPPVEIERLVWQGKVARGSEVVAVNAWGDLRVRQTGGSEVLFHAVMQKIGAKPRVARLDARTDGGRVTLTVVYPDDAQPATPREGRVDAVLLVPEGIDAHVTADRGRVLASFANKLTVRATDELVRIRTAGRVDVETRDGPVVLRVRPGGTERDRGRIHTLAGDIEVVLPGGEPAAFAVVSGASKATNALDLLRSRRREGRTVHFSRGDDPPGYALQSDSGRIILTDFGVELAAPPAVGQGDRSRD